MELADAYLLINWELLEYFKGYIACRVVVVVVVDTDTDIDIDIDIDVDIDIVSRYFTANGFPNREEKFSL